MHYAWHPGSRSKGASPPDDDGWRRKLAACAVREPHEKAARVERAAFELSEIVPEADYGEYVIVRTPATLPIVIVVPCEKPAGYTSFATEFSTLT